MRTNDMNRGRPDDRRRGRRDDYPYLGHFPDDGPPDASWTDEPEDVDEPESGKDDNVRTLDFSRSWGDQDAP